MTTLIIYGEDRPARRARQFLDAQNIDYNTLNLKHEKDALTPELIRHLLTLSDYGFEDILTRTALEMLDESASMSNILIQIMNQPTMLKFPIIIDDKKINCGFNSQITKFVSKKARETELETALGPNYRKLSNTVTHEQKIFYHVAL